MESKIYKLCKHFFMISKKHYTYIYIHYLPTLLHYYVSVGITIQVRKTFKLFFIKNTYFYSFRSAIKKSASQVYK